MTLALLLCASLGSAAGQPLSIPAGAVANSARYLGVRELTGHNDNPLIDRWARMCGLDNRAQFRRTGTGYSWCMIFAHGMYEEYAASIKQKNPLPNIAGVQNMYQYAKANELRFEVIDTDDILAGVKHAPPGSIGIMLHKNGLGHTFLVTKEVSNAVIGTREGNTNKAGSREGDGVYDKRRDTESIHAIIVVK
jgi:hypothetical protein